MVKLSIFQKIKLLFGGKIEYFNEKGQYHKLNGPAFINKRWNGWYQNGKLHRIDGPAIEDSDGDKEWWQNGKLHRIDGPAVEWTSGYKEYWKNNKKHRIDGPAIETTLGYKSYYIDDVFYSEKEYNRLIKLIAIW